MKKVPTYYKVLYDYKPAMDSYKTGISVFVDQIYLELSHRKDMHIVKSGVVPLLIKSIIGHMVKSVQSLRSKHSSSSKKDICSEHTESSRGIITEISISFTQMLKLFYYRYFVPIRIFLGNYDAYIENGYIYKPFKKLGKTKIITIIHDIGLILYDDIQSKGVTQDMRRELPISIQNSDMIITVSQTSKKDIQTYMHTIGIERPVEVVYNAPVISSQQIPVDVHTKFGIEKKYFLYLGTLEPRKNPLEVLKGFHMYLKIYDNTMQFVFAGKKGWLYDDVFEYIQKNDLQKNIIFTGFIDDSDKYWLMKEAEAFIFLSKYEGFGIPPLESLTIGTPILLNDIPVFRELYEDDAVYVNAYDPSEVAQGMHQLVSTDKKTTYACLQKFSWESSGKQFAKIIGQLVDRYQTA